MQAADKANFGAHARGRGGGGASAALIGAPRRGGPRKLLIKLIANRRVRVSIGRRGLILARAGVAGVN